jgi:precorrin-2 dehydrogenase/sirohydrochlorin ferrochelatase
VGFYPIVLDLRGRRCLVVGGGALAERRVAPLAEGGADVTVLSRALTPGLAALAGAGRIRHVARDYQDGDVADFELVLVATDGGEAVPAVAVEARARGTWINTADDPDRCDFLLPALVRRGDLVVAVATGGTSPALARAVKEELEAYLTPEYAVLAELAAEARRALRGAGRRATADAWQRALGPETRRLLVERGRKHAKLHLLASLEGP